MNLTSPLCMFIFVFLLDRPINTTLTISPQNPKLSQIIQLTCIANGKPAVSMYRFYVNDTSIGNSTNGSLSVNANDCLKFNGYFKCAPENSKGQGKIKQQLIVVTGRLSILDQRLFII